MARARRSSAVASSDAQTELGGSTNASKPAGKTKVRRTADEEVKIYQEKLAAALDRKLIEDVRDVVAAKGMDKRFIGAYVAMTRMRAWLSEETYTLIKKELGRALLHGKAPTENTEAESEDDGSEDDGSELENEDT